MSASTPIAAEVQGRRPANESYLLEGWFILVSGALATGLLGAVVGDYANDTDIATMATLATSGYLLGFLLARTRVSDLLAHLLMVLIGVIVSLLSIDPTLLQQQLRAGDWRVVTDRYEALLRGFVASIRNGDGFDADVGVFAIGLTIWLVGYTSAWMLFRRGWIFWALAVPGALLLVTLALEPERPTWPALLYLGLALAMAAGHTAVVRSAAWRSRSISHPASLSRRSIVVGCCIALLAVAAGLYASFDLDNRLQERAIARGDQLATWISGRLDPSGSSTTGPTPIRGNYGAFSDQFKVGEGIPSGDSPIAVVQAEDEEYLTARRLSEYDGTGWRASANVAQSNDPLPPRLAFLPDQTMNMSRDQLQHGAQNQASVVLLRPTDRLLFTIDQHFSTSIATLVRVGWETIDLTYEVGTIDIAEVPVDLRELIALLQASDLSDPGTSAEPRFESPERQVEFERIRDGLLTRYPVSTELSWNNSGEVQIRLVGRLPVYSDIEAVFSNDDLGGRSYTVAGLGPQATAAELSSAGTVYPAFISNTYLNLSDSVTDDTRALANQVVADSGATTPYEQAVAIQDFLRSNFTYELDAGPAPGGRDIVDYFLFDSKVGRCDHYSSSMAVMLRALGVPSRIVTGLAPVPYDATMNGYVYRGRNAHAWVEAYFPGYGWVPFEPTPTQQPFELGQSGSVPEGTPQPSPTSLAVDDPQSTQSPAAPTPSPTPSPAPVPSIVDESDDTSREPWLLAVGIGAGALTLLFGAAYFFWRRGRQFAGLPVATANFGRLQRLGRYLGAAPSPELTPREYAARFGIVRPKSASGAMQVADAFTQEQYASGFDTGTIARESEHGWQQAKAGATDWRLWRRR